MQIDIDIIVYIAVFFGLFLFIEGIYLLIFGKDASLNARVNQRLELLKNNLNKEEIVEKLRKRQNQYNKVQDLPLYNLIADKAKKGKIEFSPEQLLLVMVLIFFVSLLLLNILTSATIIFSFILSVIVGMGTVYLWVSRKASKRISLMEEQIPDAVDLIVRGLKVGYPLNSAIATAAKEMSDPIATELGIISDEAAYGRDISESIQRLSKYTGINDLMFIGVAVNIQQKSGGNLAKILDELSKTIRLRFKLHRKVKTITTEPRMSGYVFSALPVIMTFGMELLKPGYFDSIKDTPLFVPGVIVVMFLVTANIIYMQIISNLKV